MNQNDYVGFFLHRSDKREQVGLVCTGGITWKGVDCSSNGKPLSIAKDKASLWSILEDVPAGRPVGLVSGKLDDFF